MRKIKSDKSKTARITGISVLAAVTAVLIAFETGFVTIVSDSGESSGISAIFHSDKKVDSNNSVIYKRDSSPSSLDSEEIENSIKVPVSTTVKRVIDSSLLSSEKLSLKNAIELASAGSYTTSYVYDSSTMTLANMKYVIPAPSEFSLRDRTVQDVSYEQTGGDYTDFEAVYTDRTEARPAVQIYMGYILVDNGETLDIYSSDGVFLNSFDDTSLVPAYARDTDGSPLFYREYTKYTTPYSEVDVTLKKDAKQVKGHHEKDKVLQMEGELKNQDKGTPTAELSRVYYKLVNGYFYETDYNEITDSRGVNFNYPDYYGTSDNGYYISAKTYDKYLKKFDTSIEMTHTSKWAYSFNGGEITEYEFDRAYNFSEGLGCVSTERYYHDGGMFFINIYGDRAFETVKKYNNTAIDRYIIENLLPPLSNGPESIGYYYYDHGLVRARLEVIDYWNYDSNNLIRVNSSTEILIDQNGKRFSIPEGYDIKGYSNGMILLCKDGKYGFMDYTGAWIAEPIYAYAEAFSEGLGVLKTADGRYGMIDTSGNIVLSFSYKYLSSVSDGLIAAYDDTGWHIIRKMVTQ